MWLQGKRCFNRSHSRVLQQNAQFIRCEHQHHCKRKRLRRNNYQREFFNGKTLLIGQDTTILQAMPQSSAWKLSLTARQRYKGTGYVSVLIGNQIVVAIPKRGTGWRLHLINAGPRNSGHVQFDRWIAIAGKYVTRSEPQTLGPIQIRLS